jgi:hypothetical protein
MKLKIKLPCWKVYLYSVVQRYRRFLWINKGMVEFGMSNKEKGLLHGMIHKYLRKEVQREVIAIQYHDLVNIVLGSSLSIATKKEIKLAEKLILAHQINTRSLIMEMKQLKKFAKEVGLKTTAIKGLDEDELVLEIIKNLDADATYSDDFIEWYDDLPEELFDSADAIDEDEKEESDDEGEEVDYSELIEAIEEADDVDELKELIDDEDFEELFSDVDVKKNKTKKKLQKAMLEAIEEAQEAGEEETEEEEAGEEETDYSDVIEAIQEATETSELKDIADEVKGDDPELFKGITFRTGRGKAPYRELEEVQSDMLERCGVEVEESEEEEAELDITAELVNDAVEASDKEALVEMCEALEIELKPLEKKSVKKMGKKLLDSLPEEAKKSEKKKTGTKSKAAAKEEEQVEESEESCSVFQVIEEMVNDGAKEKDIVKAVTPALEERGKKKLFITKFVKQMVAVVESIS